MRIIYGFVGRGGAASASSLLQQGQVPPAMTLEFLGSLIMMPHSLREPPGLRRLFSGTQESEKAT